MWKRTDEEPGTPYQAPSPSPSPSPQRAASSVESRGRAVIGESIRVEGDVSGEEDLLVQGQVEGKIDLPQNTVTVGRPGRVKADIFGRSINVEGKVQGNLTAEEQVVVRDSGEVHGNITAPRVILEDGAKFKGSIDMEPTPRGGAAKKLDSDSESKARAASAGGPQGAQRAGSTGSASDGKPSSPELARSGSPVSAGAKA